MTIDVVYIAINIALLVFFFIVGQKVANRKRFWLYSVFCIAAFTFVQGARYMRGHDYGEYCRQFLWHDVSTNPVFVTINEILAMMGFNQYSCFAAYAFAFILGGMFFMKEYKAYAKYLFPLFLLGFMAIEEYMIRQSFSYSFFFCFLVYLFRLDLKNRNFRKNDIFLCIFFAVITASIHTANIINIFVFTTLFFLLRFPIHYMWGIPVYVMCVYVFPEMFNFDWLAPVLNVAASNNERAAMYVAKSSQWFSAAGAEDRYTRNAIIQLIETVGVSSLLYLGYVTIRKKMANSRPVVTMYNVYFLGICIMSLFRNLELLNRVGQLFNAYWCVVLAFVLYYRSELMSKKRFVAYIGLLWFLYDYLKYLFFRDGMTQFIWDAPSYVRFFN